MTEKRRNSGRDDPTSRALEAANQALAAANAAVQAAVKALALTHRQEDDDDQSRRRGRGSIRNAASQARRRLSTRADDDASGVAPLASSVPAARAPAARPATAQSRPAPEARAAARPKPCRVEGQGSAALRPHADARCPGACDGSSASVPAGRLLLRSPQARRPGRASARGSAPVAGPCRHAPGPRLVDRGAAAACAAH